MSPRLETGLFCKICYNILQLQHFLMHLDTVAKKLRGVTGAYKNEKKTRENSTCDFTGATPPPLETSAARSHTRHSITFFFSFWPEPLEINYCASKKKLGPGFSLFLEAAEINYWKTKKKLFPEKDFHFFRGWRKLITLKRKKTTFV